METLLLFLAGHAVCDFALQGEVMGNGKSRRKALAAPRPPGFPPWYAWLSAHALIHGGAVCLIAGAWPFGVVEAFLHAGIDHLKCEEHLSFNQDQALHLLCKLVYLPFLV